MKKLLFSTFLFLFLLNVEAQQEQQYSQYVINPFTINPAIAGTEDFIDLQLGYRSQWTGFEGAPKTTYLTGHGTLGKSQHQYHSKADHKNWHGIGFQYFNDKTGPLRRDAFLLAYAYNMGLSKNTRLSVGTYVGFRQVRTDQSYWENIDDQTDNLFTSDLNTGLQPDVQFGAAIYNPKYFVYLSGANLLGNQMSFKLPENNQTHGSEAVYQRHFFLSGGLKLKASYDVTFTPSVLLKYALQSPASFDVSLKVDHKNKYWYGASFRAIESLNIFAGLNISDRVDVSYAYEWTVTKISGYNYGTHEIIVGLRIRHPKNIICPSKYW